MCTGITCRSYIVVTIVSIYRDDYTSYDIIARSDTIYYYNTIASNYLDNDIIVVYMYI